MNPLHDSDPADHSHHNLDGVDVVGPPDHWHTVGVIGVFKSYTPDGDSEFWPFITEGVTAVETVGMVRLLDEVADAGLWPGQVTVLRKRMEADDDDA